MSHDPFWHVVYGDYEPKEESLREALCTLGNGYFATRGAFEDSDDDNIHYPGTYLPFGYNRLDTEISGRIITNEDLVNWPNWLVLKFRIDGGDWINIDQVRIISYEQKLDLQKGYLERYIHFEDNEKRETLLVTKRIVSMAHKHQAAIQWCITPRNWSGTITVHSALDGTVTNNGVARYRDLQSQHLKIIDTHRFNDGGISLEVETVQSKIRMAQSAKTIVEEEGVYVPVKRETVSSEGYIAQELKFPVHKNRPVNVEKIVAIFTSKDTAISDPLTESQTEVHRTESFKQLYEPHCTAWQEIWDRVDTEMDSEKDEDQLILRFHIFHLYQTASLNTIELDVGIPSRGWHGEAYRGHIFWDELFIFPTLNISSPELTRTLLMYRYRRLPEARCNATAKGYKGAMYPWQSGSNGREESQELHLNPQSGNWIPDNTFLQRHVNAAIVYNIWHYYQASNDHEFLVFYGAEMILDIAKFWASKAEWDADKHKYVINEVVGPDEYHTSYPHGDEPGINNNAYTNVMVIYVFKHALETLQLLDNRRKGELMRKLELTKEEIDRWENISRNIFIPFIGGSNIIAQFEGFEDLKELDWEKYHEKHGEILRLDRILESEGGDVNQYKAVKQADVIMLFYLFSSEELISLIRQVGYEFTAEDIPDNIDYYNKITSHGSTLSKVVFSWVLARSDRSKSWHNFQKALMSDFKDIQGGTTSEGIHLGAMAGTVDLIRRCYTGMEIRDNQLFFNPRLPKSLGFITFTFKYRSHWILLHLTAKELQLMCVGGWAPGAVKIGVLGKEFQLNGNKKVTVKYDGDLAKVIEEEKKEDS